MTPYYQDDVATLWLGDCLAVMPSLAECSVDSIVTDPPYGLSFMGKDWDHGIPGEHFWREALRVAKPGAHLLAFGGTRTFHRLMVAIEDAGWEIRDTIMWVYGSGFPKSLDVSKAIDKAAGADPVDLGESPNWRESKRDREKNGSMEVRGENAGRMTAPATDAARRWSGWGTALKPAWEPIIVARKPLAGTVAQNVQRYGTGAINVDGCRVDGAQGSGVWGSSNEGCQDGRTFNASPDGEEYRSKPFSRPLRVIDPKPEANGSVYAGRREAGGGFDGGSKAAGTTTVGRWPANLIHDGSEEVLAGFPHVKSGLLKSGTQRTTSGGYHGNFPGTATVNGTWGDEGSAARFFYCAKASRQDRNEGCEGMETHTAGECTDRQEGTAGLESPRAGAGRTNGSRNHHPTVKPVALMRYLCRLVTPPGGIVLDPFMGSGSTGKGALREGFRFIGIEQNAEYVEIAKERIVTETRQEVLPL